MSRLLVMDSGLGGLSIVQCIQQHMPKIAIHYLADNAALPYGNKDAGWLIKRIHHLLTPLIHNLNPSMIVIACNTASTVVLPTLRSLFNIPVAGVVPAIKPAAKESKSKHIGLLATPATIKRQYTTELINNFAANCRISSLGTTELVRIAEQKLHGEQVDLKRLQHIMRPLFELDELDSIILGCTHFPLLRQELEAIQPRPIQWFDTGTAVAQQVKLLQDNHSKPLAEETLTDNQTQYQSYLTQQPEQATKTKLALANFGFTPPKVIDFIQRPNRDKAQ